MDPFQAIIFFKGIDYEEKYKAEPDYVMLVRNVNRLSSCKRCNNLLYQRSTCSCLSGKLPTVDKERLVGGFANIATIVNDAKKISKDVFL